MKINTIIERPVYEEESGDERCVLKGKIKM